MAASPSTLRRPTSRDVARLVGVSQATVSLVLNGQAEAARVSVVTRDRVLHAADQLGYAPDHAARSLRSRRSGVLAFVLPALENPYFAEVVSAAQAAARARGLVVTVIPARSEAEELEALARLRGGSADGVAGSARTEAVADALRGLRRRGVAVAVLQDAPPAPDIPAVGVDLEAGGHLATSHLVALGHRRIAHLVDASSYALRRRDRTDGYRRALAEAGLPFDPDLVTQAANSAAGGAAAMQALLRRAWPRERRPTAVFAFNDQMALGALHALHAAGLRVPQDMAVVGFDGIAAGAYAVPAITTVDHPRAELGRRTAEALMAVLDDDAPPAAGMLPVRLLVRQSCGGVEQQRAGRQEQVEAASEGPG